VRAHQIRHTLERMCHVDECAHRLRFGNLPHGSNDKILQKQLPPLARCKHVRRCSSCDLTGAYERGKFRCSFASRVPNSESPRVPLRTHASARAGIQGFVVGPQRSLASIKDTNWVLDRQPLASRLPDGSADGLLQTDTGSLLEGLVTNLFVIRAVLAYSVQVVIQR
jgi:hypothetical protein